MASGWNLWVWLECIGVVIIIITFPCSTCISSLAAASLFKMFFRSCLCYFCEIYSNIAQRTFEIVQKSRTENNIIQVNYYNYNIIRTTSPYSVPRGSE